MTTTHWTPEEIAILREGWASMTASEIAAYIHRPPCQISRKANNLGLRHGTAAANRARAEASRKSREKASRTVQAMRAAGIYPEKPEDSADARNTITIYRPSHGVTVTVHRMGG